MRLVSRVGWLGRVMMSVRRQTVLVIVEKAFLSWEGLKLSNG
jgi:hypothetical protein